MSQTPDNHQSTVRVSSWYGRRSADPNTISCTQNGWREAVWKRDRRGRWYEASATLRPVVELALDGSGAFKLGEARRV